MARLKKLRSPFTGQFDLAPRYSLPALLKMRAKLNYVIQELEFEGLRLTEERLAALRRCVLPLIPRTSVSERPDMRDEIVCDQGYLLEDMLQHWHHAELTEQEQWRLVTFLSAAMEFLAVRQPLPRWDTPKAPVWTGFEVTDLERLPARNTLFHVTYQALTGPLAGNTINKRVAGSGLYAFLREIGFRSFEVTYPPEYAAGMFFTARASQGRSGMELVDPFVSSSMNKLNRERFKSRQGKCIGGYRHYEKQCAPPCPFGRDVCPNGYHATTYRRKGRCIWPKDRHDGRLTPEGGGLCLACIYKGRHCARSGS